MDFFNFLFHPRRALAGIRRRVRERCEDSYESIVSKDAPWVLFCYVTDAFYHAHDDNLMNSHQNRREAVLIVQVFNRLGYNVYVRNYLSERELPHKDFKIIMGHEPVFEKAVFAYPQAYKIYYATGADFRHQNKQIKYITDKVNKEFNSNLEYKRLVKPHNAYYLADRILLIGSKYTVATFEEDVQKKITMIHQSTQSCAENVRIHYSTENHFFFMASAGSLLRGVSFLIDYFLSNPEKTLHIVGQLDDDYLSFIMSHLTPNIILHGFLPVGGEEMRNVSALCNFVVYPSGSEGCPGSVLNAMKYGLIPIVTKWAADDQTDRFGYIMKEWSAESLEDGIRWACGLSQEEILRRKESCSAYVKSQYNLEQYEQEFRTFIKKQTNIV